MKHKKQKVGNVPILRFPGFEGEWEELPLGEIAEIKTGPFGSTLHKHDYVDKGTPIVTVEHIGELGIIHKNLPLVSDKDKARLKSYHLRTGDIIFSRVGSIDRSALVSDNENGWLFSGRLLRVRLKVHNPSFFNYSFKLENIKQKIRSVAVGQIMPSLNTEILKGLRLNTPGLIDEQEKIGAFLSLIDYRIQTQSKLIEGLTVSKLSVSKNIFEGKIQIPNSNVNWPSVQLNEVLNIPEKDKANTFDRNKLLTVKLHLKGVCKNENAETLTEGATNYFIRRKGQFIYGKQNLFNGAFGIIPEELDGYLSSADVPTLDINYSKINPSFLLHFLGRENFYKKLEEIASGSGSKRIHEAILLNISIPLPSLDVQNKIADILNALDNKINIEKNILTQLEKQKRHLLQNLFV